MKNIKLRKLLGGISASVLAGGSVLAVTACNNPKKDQESLATQVTKFIEADGTILFVGGDSNITKVISKIKRIVPELKNGKNRLALNGSESEAIVIKKDAKTDVLTNAVLEAGKYNFVIKVKENVTNKESEIKGSFEVKLTSKPALDASLLDKFNTEYIKTTLTDNVTVGADLTSKVTEAINAAIQIQWEDKAGITVTDLPETLTAATANKDKHDVAFKLNGTAKSKEFKVSFKYNIQAVTDLRVDISGKTITISETILTVADGSGKITLAELQKQFNTIVANTLKGVDGIDSVVANTDFELEFKTETDVAIDDGTNALTLTDSAVKIKVIIKSKPESTKIKGDYTVLVDCKK